MATDHVDGDDLSLCDAEVHFKVCVVPGICLVIDDAGFSQPRYRIGDMGVLDEHWIDAIRDTGRQKRRAMRATGSSCNFKQSQTIIDAYSRLGDSIPTRRCWRCR